MSPKNRTSTLLVADDDSVVRKLIGFQFERAGLYCSLFESGDHLLESINEDTHVCVLDLKMPGKSGIECLKSIKSNFPHIEVVILTYINQAAEAVETVKAGAFDYITKPFEPETLIASVRKAMRMSRKQKENLDLRNSLSEPSLNFNIIGESDAMARVNKLIAKVASSENTVLLTGESGTGKTLHAHAIHADSPRSQGPFIGVNCPSLPGELLESEMFGHEKGAFSGAVRRRLGRAELAHNGTLFLDEIGDMPLNLQAKLLTFIQEKTFYRLGGEKPLTSNTRIIAATNQNLKELIEKGQFREDLYFRLNVLPIFIPPLRDRASDIPFFIDYFMKQVADQNSESPPLVNSKVYEALKSRDWKGNIRELENAVTRAYTLRQNEKTLELSDFFLDGSAKKQSTHKSDPKASVSQSNELIGLSMAEVEKRIIAQTLKSYGNNKSEAASVLGISLKSIYNKIKKYGLNQ